MHLIKKKHRTVFCGLSSRRHESPPIFNMYMDFVMPSAKHQILKQCPDIRVLVEFYLPNEVSPRVFLRRAPASGWRRVTELLCADDVVIFTKSVEELGVRSYQSRTTPFLDLDYS